MIGEKRETMIGNIISFLVYGTVMVSVLLYMFKD